MIVADLLKAVRRRLRESIPDADALWEDDELIEEYANASRNRLFLRTDKRIIDGWDTADTRFTLDALTSADKEADLGFRVEYHEDLIPWILHLAFLKKDANTDRPDLAEYYRTKFDKRCAEIRAELYDRFGNFTITPSTQVI